jgi:hypothetical protein
MMGSALFDDLLELKGPHRICDVQPETLVDKWAYFFREAVFPVGGLEEDERIAQHDLVALVRVLEQPLRPRDERRALHHARCQAGCALAVGRALAEDPPEVELGRLHQRIVALGAVLGSETFDPPPPCAAASLNHQGPSTWHQGPGIWHQGPGSGHAAIDWHRAAPCAGLYARRRDAPAAPHKELARPEALLRPVLARLPTGRARPI